MSNDSDSGKHFASRFRPLSPMGVLQESCKQQLHKTLVSRYERHSPTIILNPLASPLKMCVFSHPSSITQTNFFYEIYNIIDEPFYFVILSLVSDYKYESARWERGSLNSTLFVKMTQLSFSFVQIISISASTLVLFPQNYQFL